MQHQDLPHWQSPIAGGPVACKRCINQSARILETDPESGWKAPAKTST
jgi:hypothetical protein